MLTARQPVLCHLSTDCDESMLPLESRGENSDFDRSFRGEFDQYVIRYESLIRRNVARFSPRLIRVFSASPGASARPTGTASTKFGELQRMSWRNFGQDSGEDPQDIPHLNANSTHSLQIAYLSKFRRFIPLLRKWDPRDEVDMLLIHLDKS